MKKRDLANLAMIGISAGLMLGGCQKNPNQPKGSHSGGQGNRDRDRAMEQMNPDLQSFYSSLSPEAQKKFMQLDAQHKMMAIEMANQGPNEKNSCAGIGGCKTVQHDCAGKNSCKGQGGTPIKDPNKAVDIQYNNQTNQRQKTNGGMGGSNPSSAPSSSQYQSNTKPNNPNSPPGIHY